MADHLPTAAPEQLFMCQACEGSGVQAHRITVYEHGCGFPHDDTAEKTCEQCGGLGTYLADAEPDG